MSFSPLTPSVVPSPLTPVGPVEPPYILQLLSSWSNPATTTAPFLALTGLNVYYGIASKVDVAFIGVQALLLFATAKYIVSTPGQGLSPTSWDLLLSSSLIVTVLYGLYSLYRAIRA